MSLKEYARKRDFTKTPEPPPSAPAPASSQARFFIQRHDATRLHYDFRLEIAGTLKSWAVPKGPSLDPTRKSLAMHVEDHPLDYGPFEGNIPKGNYGGGSVMLWDFGTFEVLGDGNPISQLERGDLKFRLHGSKINGEFALVRMKGRGKGNEWLLIKKRDESADESWDIETHAYSAKTGRTQEEIAQDLPPKNPPAKSSAKKSGARKSADSATKKTAAKAAKKTPKSARALTPESIPGARLAPMPSLISPMMAFVAEKPPAGPKWLYEVKWDGVRSICFLQNGALRMVSRAGNSFDRQYPELSVVPHYVDAETAILDGEIAVLDEKGRSRFELIQPRIHQTDPNSVAHLSRSTPVKLYVFDLLYWDGYDLRGAPLAQRKAALREIVRDCPRMQYSEHFAARGEEMLEAARALGLEGVLAKDGESKYEERRSRSWLKVKVNGQQEFVICGYTHGERDTFSSLVLGVYNGGKLTWAGNVGTGFDDRILRSLNKKLRAIETPECPFGKVPSMLREATWVRPELVCEVKFLEWTREGKLRAPVYLGLRDDKRSEEVVRESAPVAKESPVEAEPRKPGGPLIPEKSKEIALNVDGITLKFGNLNKIWFPNERYNKRDVLNYYDAVADLLLPYLADRPLSLKRYPNGIHEQYFFQKDIPENYPEWLRIEPVHSEHRGEAIRYVIANDRATLLYLTNLGCIDQNPWMSRAGSLDWPDFMLIDLDPQECSYDLIVDAALLVKHQLDKLELTGCPKTTGGDGMHIYVPLDPRYTYEEVRSFAEILAQLVIGEQPDLFTTPRSVARRRRGRVYFDYLQISSSKTISAPYVVRPYDGAPVATPLAWEEVQRGISPKDFHMRNVLERFEKQGDLFAPVLTERQRLEPALRRLQKLIADSPAAKAAVR